MNEILNSAGIWLAESGVLPDSVLSGAIRRACGNRLEELRREYGGDRDQVLAQFIDQLNSAAVAESTTEANEQHYELPPEFFGLILGPHRKYSGCDWDGGVTTLADAEELALNRVVERAGIRDGDEILELGCGWGSLTLFMADRFRRSRVVAVSNSRPQRETIMGLARERGLSNVEVITADINSFDPGRIFDRIVTIEMLEHVRNYSALFARISSWLKPDGQLFVHIFRHMEFAYLFEVEGSKNWMGRYFFTGGVMPSHDLLAQAQSSLVLRENWVIGGEHYARTADAWLANMDANRLALLDILGSHYGEADAELWFVRWRMFFMACRELFGFDGGSEWGVSHYLFGHV